MGIAPTQSSYTSRTTPFTNIPYSRSNTHPTTFNRRGTSFTLGMAEQASWCIHQHSGRTRTSPGHMQMSLRFTTLSFEQLPTRNRKRWWFYGYDGCNAAQSALLDQIHGTTPGSLSFRGLASPTRSTLSIRHTSSVLATSSLPSMMGEPTNSLIHLLLGTQREIGVLTMRIGMVSTTG